MDYKDYTISGLNRTIDLYEMELIELELEDKPNQGKIETIVKELTSLNIVLKEKLQAKVVNPLSKGDCHTNHRLNGESKNVGATYGAHNVSILERITPDVKYRPYNIEHYGHGKITKIKKCYSKSFEHNEVKPTSKTIDKTIAYKSLREKIAICKMEHDIEHIKSRGDGIQGLSVNCEETKVKGRRAGGQSHPKYSMFENSRCFKYESCDSGTRLPKYRTEIQPVKRWNKMLGRFKSSKEIRPISEFVKWFLSIEPSKETNSINCCHYSLNTSTVLSHDYSMENASPTGMPFGTTLAFIESYICLCAGIDFIKPHFEILDLNSKAEPMSIAYTSIENPKVEPVSDLSTGGGVNKVHMHDLEMVVDQSESTPSPYGFCIPTNIVQPTYSRPKWTRRSLDRLSINVAPTIVLLADYSNGLCSIIVWTTKYGSYQQSIGGLPWPIYYRLY